MHQPLEDEEELTGLEHLKGPEREALLSAVYEMRLASDRERQLTNEWMACPRCCRIRERLRAATIARQAKDLTFTMLADALLEPGKEP